MSNSYIGIDSTNFHKQGKLTFKAPLGVAVEVEDFEAFKIQYLTIIEALKKKYVIDSPRLCLKSHFVYEKIGILAENFISDFVLAITPSLKTIYTNHTILSNQKTPDIFCYEGLDKISVSEFVGILSSYYVHIIAWQLLIDFPDKKKSIMFLDHFTGVITKAWLNIEANNNIFVLPGGEFSNPLISTADLISKYISNNIHNNGNRLDFNGISFAFTNLPIGDNKTNLIQKFIYNLPFITPHQNRAMEVDAKLKHPVYFILTSKKFQKERQTMELSPLYDIISNLAYQNSGCTRALNLDEINKEIKYMKNGDHIIAIGDDALSTANYLINDLTGLPINVISSRELLKKKEA